MGTSYFGGLEKGQVHSPDYVSGLAWSWRSTYSHGVGHQEGPDPPASHVCSPCAAPEGTRPTSALGDTVAQDGRGEGEGSEEGVWEQRSPSCSSCPARGQDSDGSTQPANGTPRRRRPYPCAGPIGEAAPGRAATSALTLVRELKPEPVLRVVAVEADARLVRGAQQGRRGVLAAELPDRGARGGRPVLNFKVVVVGFGREVQELNVCACGKHRRDESASPCAQPRASQR